MATDEANEITKIIIEIDPHFDVIFKLEGSDEDWSYTEFDFKSETGMILGNIHDNIVLLLTRNGVKIK